MRLFAIRRIPVTAGRVLVCLIGLAECADAARVWQDRSGSNPDSQQIQGAPAAGSDSRIWQSDNRSPESPAESSAPEISDEAMSRMIDDSRVNGDGELNAAFKSAQNNPGTGIGSDFFGVDDDFSKGLVIRGNGVAMKLSGLVKADFIYDFNPIGATDLFDVTTIEIGASPRTNSRFHARQTKLSFDTRWDSGVGPLRTFVEADFFFNQRQIADTGGLGTDRFRLRHAFAEVGDLTVGQTWTTFSDMAASPATLDFEGQVASVTTRRAQIRWTRDIADSGWSIALALEDPFAIIELPDGVSGETRTETPDGVFRLRWTRPLVQAQLAGVVRELGFQPTGQTIVSDQAWGLNFTQVMKLTRRTKFYSEVIYGQGIGSFRGLPDVASTPGGPELAEIVGFVGWMVGGTHEWNSRLSSNLTYAENRIPRNVALGPDELDNTTYMAANLIYSPTDRYEFGIEYLYGLRENVSGASGVANRVQVAFIFYLP